MKIIAHRGASGEFPENSLLAFEQAIIQGCDGIEFDAQYHQASGEFILLHDSFVNYGGDLLHYNQLTLDQLINTFDKTRASLCTLKQALECIKNHCRINIELKTAAQGKQLALEMQKLTTLLEQEKNNHIINFKDIIISSFNHHVLVKMANQIPEITTAALIASCPIDYANFCQPLQVEFLNLSIECLNTEIIADAHRRGLQVWVYTVDHPEQIKRCVEYQVDGIFTNFPQRSRQIVNELNNQN